MQLNVERYFLVTKERAAVYVNICKCVILSLIMICTGRAAFDLGPKTADKLLT